MTPTQLVALALLVAAALALVIMFVRTWRKTRLPKPRHTTSPEPKPAKATPVKEREWNWPQQAQRKPPSLLELSKRRHPSTGRGELPKSFTSRPSVKKAQVNLKKTGYKEDAKIEEEPKRRR